MALTEKICAFIEEAKYVGHETPAHKYDVNYVTKLLIDPNFLFRIELMQI